MRTPTLNDSCAQFKQECLNRVIPFGECQMRQRIAAYVEHHHREWNHQSLNNALIDDRTYVADGEANSPSASARGVAQLLRMSGVKGTTDQ